MTGLLKFSTDSNLTWQLRSMTQFHFDPIIRSATANGREFTGGGPF